MPRRKKAIEEDWDKEIEEEKKKKEKKPLEFRLLIDEIKRREEPGCKHYKTFWWYEPYTMLLCKECYVIIEERKIKRNDVGYGFRNHTKNGRKAK